MFGRRKIAALVAEFLGAGVLTIVILNVMYGAIHYSLFTAAAAGLALMVMSYVVGEVSGGYFNPAITLGQWVVGKVQTLSAILYIAVELLGAWLAYYLFTYIVANHPNTIGGHYTTHILVAEAVGTAVLSFAFTALAYKGLTRGVTAAYYGISYIVASTAV